MRAGLLAVALGLALTPSLSAGSSAARWFSSPSRNIECQVTAGGAYPTTALCLTFRPMRSVTLDRSGEVRICRGVRCMSNPPENTPVLRYGASVTVGPFRCLSLRIGVRCLVVSKGVGFLINRESVRLVGHR